MSIGQRIKQRREELGITQEQLAKRLNVSKSAVGNYEADICTPKIDNIVKLYGVLRCDPNYLFEADKSKEAIPSAAEMKLVKRYRSLDKYGKDLVDVVLEAEYNRCTAEQEKPKAITISLPKSTLKASAGTGERLDDEGYKRIDVLDTPEARKATLIIEVHGDSMLPNFADGDLVLVDSNAVPKKGDVGIFIVNGEGYIKQLGDGVLISLNSDYDNIAIHDGDSCYTNGVVVGVAEAVKTR